MHYLLSYEGSRLRAVYLNNCEGLALRVDRLWQRIGRHDPKSRDRELYEMDERSRFRAVVLAS